MQWNLLTLTPRRSDVRRTSAEDAGSILFIAHGFLRTRRDRGNLHVRRAVNAVPPGQCFATQFHPEKSGRWGVSMLGNFVRIAAEATVR